MTIAPLTWRRSAALALGASLLLTGCTGASAEDPEPATKQESSKAAPGKTSEKAAASSPAACKELTQEADVVVDGKVLGTCIGEATSAAKTGKLVVTSTPDLPTNATVFEFVPEYTAYGTRDGQPSILLTRDSGYMHSAGRWLEADPASSDPAVQMVTAGINLAKQSSVTESMTSVTDLCPQWVSMGKTEITNGAELSGYQYQCEGTYELLGVTVLDLSIWLDDEFRMIQQMSTGQAGEMTVPSVVNYSGWGESVDMPKPEDLK